ncbi:hypothetical protein ANCDUO_22111, partial [Ancylostoma duodenale]
NLKTFTCDEAGTIMTCIPDTFSILPDGSMFVHRLESTLHMNYNSNTLQMAGRNGLHTLVTDGVHSFQPRQLKQKGQLYTVHGLCCNDVEMPLLYAISSKKTEQNVFDSPNHQVQARFLYLRKNHWQTCPSKPRKTIKRRARPVYIHLATPHFSSSGCPRADWPDALGVICDKVELYILPGRGKPGKPPFRKVPEVP